MKRPMQEMGSRMISLYLASPWLIHFQNNISRQTISHGASDLQIKSSSLFGDKHYRHRTTIRKNNFSRIAHLTSHLGVEGRTVDHRQLILILFDYLDQARFRFVMIESNKFRGNRFLDCCDYLFLLSGP